jgi:hypothetical protein
MGHHPLTQVWWDDGGFSPGVVASKHAESPASASFPGSEWSRLVVQYDDGSDPETHSFWELLDEELNRDDGASPEVRA